MGRRRILPERISNKKARYASFHKRRMCMEKKTFELSTLCGVEACMVVYDLTHDDDDRQPYIWPKDPDAIRHMFTLYKKQHDENRKKWTLNLSHFFKDDPNKKKEEGDHHHQGTTSLAFVKVEDKKNDDNETTKYLAWDDQYNNLSEEQLRDLSIKLKEKFEAAKTKVQFLKDSFLATQENNSNYFMPSMEPITDHEQQPISFFNQIDHLDMPAHYPPLGLDLSMPNSTMMMNDIEDYDINGLGDIMDVNNVIMEPQMCYYGDSTMALDMECHDMISSIKQSFEGHEFSDFGDVFFC
ncbi:agamous-like MADS-box protein AGL82 [Cornus florida]|uniref:agamous-like MADS-box protein AGL82 n=1 Tax=Cornus florida TaxID=4283 RepID=UPI00289C68AD|nr:agamous-like MADS-box protein AGL82 [Cornus florida]